MEVPTYVALSRMMAQQRSLEVTATNLANASTPGFKAERMLFSDWLGRQNQVDTPPGGKTVAYTQDRATYREQAAGPLTHTANPFDIAVSGDGYFTVDTARGPRLTRAGRFTPMADGRMGDQDGNALLDSTGKPLRVASTDTRITIAADGSVSSENGPLGRIGLVQPTDSRRVTAEGARLLRADSPTAPVVAPKIVQGAVEDSNVQPVIELTRMMAELRDFQFTAQFVQGEADRQQNAINKLTQTKQG